MDLVAKVRLTDGKVLVGFKPPDALRTSETGVVPAISRTVALRGREAIEALGAEITMTFPHTSAVAATIPPELVPRIRKLDLVDYVEPAHNGVVTQTMATQDTSWGVKRIRAHLVWAQIGSQSTRGNQANVTILDTGLDYTHFSSPTGDGPQNALGDCWYTATSTITTCYDDLTNDAIRGHGSHVAGIIAARDNDRGFIGIAHEPAKFASIRVCDNNGCPVANVISGLGWVLQSARPRHVVNISLGYCAHSTTLQSTLAQLQAAGVLVIASAGNIVPGAPQSHVCGTEQNNLPDWATSVMYPARYAEVMAVSGTLGSDQFAATYSPPAQPGGPGWEPPECGREGCAAQSLSCSNGSGSRYGPEIEIAAPFRATSMAPGGLYIERCGTSMSAPAVAATAALVWSRNPTWTAAQVRQRLKSTAIPALPSTHFGAGRVDAYNAVYVAPPVYSASITGPLAVRSGARCSFSASTSSPHAPYTYDWSAGGVPFGAGGQLEYHTAGASHFDVSVVVHDALGGQTTAFHSVEVDAGAPECYDQ